MSKAIKLNIKPTFDFLLIGIVSSEPIYKLSFLINDMLQIQLKESDQIKNYHQKRNVYQAFELFTYINSETEERIDLIHNKGAQGFLIEEQKQVDFWLKIENGSLESTKIIAALKTLKNISLVLEIKPDSLKSKNNFLFANAED